MASGSSGLGSSLGQGHCVVLSTLTVPLSTQVYKWVPANLMLGLILRCTNIPFMRGVEILLVAFSPFLTLDYTRLPRFNPTCSSDKFSGSHIFKQLQGSERCLQSCSADCFETLIPPLLIHHVNMSLAR